MDTAVDNNSAYHNILIQKTPKITYQDLRGTLSDEDCKIVDQFEEAWEQFLVENPKVIPLGEIGKRMSYIEKTIMTLEKQSNNVDTELQHQLEFFSKSKEQLEGKSEKRMEEAARRQQKVYKDLNHQLDNVALAAQHCTTNMAWEFFFDTFEQYAIQEEEKGLFIPPPDVICARGVRPSLGAMLVVNNQPDKPRTHEFILKAYQIDNAILKAKIKCLEREDERYEKVTESLEILGKFLTEHNIWGLLAANKQKGRGR